MKTDDFEKKLRRQSPRPIPAEWREGILATCQPGRSPDSADSVPLWQLICRRFPVAWGALAMLWAALIAANLFFSVPHRRISARTFSARPEPLAVWNLQKAELSLLSDQPADATEQHLAKPARPRSERRRHEGYVEVLGGPPVHLNA